MTALKDNGELMKLSFPFQKTARWLSLAFLAGAMLLGGWAYADADEPTKRDIKGEPREISSPKLKVDPEVTAGIEVVDIHANQPADPADSALSPHHKMFYKLVGDWTAQVRVYPAPGSDPIEAHGVARSQIILAGRGLKMDYKGDMGGIPFVGFGLDGFDMDKQEHYSLWMDSMGTGVSHERGSECSHDEYDTVTFFGEALDPASGKEVKTKSVLSMRSTSRYTMENWILPESGEPTLAMQIIFAKQ